MQSMLDDLTKCLNNNDDKNESLENINEEQTVADSKIEIQSITNTQTSKKSDLSKKSDKSQNKQINSNHYILDNDSNNNIDKNNQGSSLTYQSQIENMEYIPKMINDKIY